MPASGVFQLAARLVLQGPAGDDSVRMAREVMQGPDFWWKRLQPGVTPDVSWLRKVAGAILEVIAKIGQMLWDAFLWFIRLFSLRFTGEASGGTTVVWILAVAIIAWAAWKLIPLFLRGAARASNAESPDPLAAETLPAASELRDEALRALNAGRHADAVRLALLSLIAALEQRGLLRYDATRTNREYRAELRPRPDLADRFGQLARIYERIWYGRLPAGREQAEESIRLCTSPIDGEGRSPA